MRAWGLLVVSLCCGCATLSNFESARTLEPGKWQLGVEGRYLATTSKLGGESNVWPSAVVRRGMTKHFELGLRAGGRPEVFGKVQLLDTGPDGVAISLSQTLGVWRWTYFTGNSHTQGWSRTALPIGVPLGSSELVVAPQVHLAFGGSDSGASGFALLPSLSVGFVWRPLWWLGVMPQVSVGYSAVSVASREVFLGGGVALEGGVAVLFGGREGF
jgi:hypothetical protein